MSSFLPYHEGSHLVLPTMRPHCPDLTSLEGRGGSWAREGPIGSLFAPSPTTGCGSPPLTQGESRNYTESHAPELYILDHYRKLTERSA